MLQKTLNAANRLLLTWAILCLAAFFSGLALTFLGAPRWLPLPWSDFTDFVESADGKVFVDLGFYGHVLCYGHEGNFIASYPYPSPAKDTELAASADGRLFFRAQHLLYVYDSTWHQLSEFKGDFNSARKWMLDDQGKPVFLLGYAYFPTADKLAKPGDLIFSKQQRREKFACGDGTTLVRQGNSLQRRTAKGTVLTTYSAPIVFRLFTFPWPAILAWPYLVLYGILTAQKKRIVRQSATQPTTASPVS